MTQRDDLPRRDDDDALAAEYVLGVLSLRERTLAEARARAEPAFAALITAWEIRLSPMNEDFAEVPAPDLLPALEARLFPTATAPKRRFGWSVLGGAVAAAALAAAVLLWQAAPPVQPGLTARLAAEAQSLQFEALVQPADETVTIRRVSGTGPAAGRDYQLWVIGAEGVPRPLGLLRAEESVLPLPAPAAGLVLAVSLEPAGGSPTGLPTGPVLVTGTLTGG